MRSEGGYRQNWGSAMTNNRQREKFQYRELLNEIELGSSHTSVLLAATLLDELLMGAIQHNMVPLSKAETDRVFKFNGALGHFSSRIVVGYGMGPLWQEGKA